MSEVKKIAFYLPQFHPIPENDLWWGKGFTEWTNVKKIKPVFEGHHQPNVPTEELGYYDLRDIEVIKKQAEIAVKYGISGFCFYYYWFDGKKLLDTPLKNLLNNKKPDFPFCICWANENWTRRWDGKESEILINQNHTDKDDEAFIRGLLNFFLDKRYIKINDKPLLIIYRTSLFPDIKKSAGIWRRIAKEEGFPDLYLARVEGMDDELDPKSINFDASIEFAPDWRRIGQPINQQKDLYSEFVEKKIFHKSSPALYDYCLTMNNMINRPAPNYKYFRGAFPSWDNTPRRAEKGTVFWGSNPDYFQYFLSRQIVNTLENKLLSDQEKFVFINAWNEWGEGCYLEPDKINGHRNLEAVREATRLKVPNSTTTLPLINKLDSEIKDLSKTLELASSKNKVYEQDIVRKSNEIADIMSQIQNIKNSKTWKLRNRLAKFMRREVV
jgi:lipopolysaccharide biosynthesis protein